LIISFFDSAKDNIPKQSDVTFAELASILEAHADCARHRLAKEFTPAVVPANFDPPRRAKVNVQQRFAFTGDVDDGAILDFAEMAMVLGELRIAHILHTTTKSTFAANRYRVIIPFLEPLTTAEYEAACSSIHQMLGEVFDTKTFDAGRLSFVPQAWHGAPEDYETWDDSNAHHAFVYSEGSPLDAHAIMEAYPPKLPQSVTEADLSAYLQPLANVDPDLTDLDLSPLVTERMRDDFAISPPGGRFYRFMIRVAGRALRKGIPVDEHIILSLAMKMNARVGSPKRINARHEARNAIRFAAKHHVEDARLTREQEIQKQIQRLQSRKAK
jgi:hypothetical protein